MRLALFVPSLYISPDPCYNLVITIYHALHFRI